MQHKSRYPRSCSVRKRNTACFFVTKLICFDFRVNYLHNAVQWLIKTEFVIEKLNTYDMQKQTCEHVNLNYCIL